MYSARKCEGFVEEHEACPGLESCNACKPVDCVFREWSTWTDMGGCTGLKLRTRSVRRENNHCGHPCAGPTEETKKWPVSDDSCSIEVKDCLLGDWTDWTECEK